MPKQKVLIKGSKTLGKPSRALKKEELSDYRRFIEELKHTMETEKGIGIAAPQVGENIRIICIHQDALDESEHLILFNPKLTYKSKQTMETEEGCLSVPGVMGLVERPEKVRVKYLDVEGNKQQIKAKGMLSCILQHEIDHLDGVLFTDKMHKITKNEGKVEL